ncbi:uncharacterized protein MEPE_06156 [Melanopsichium pennsylvanicum]|uniref:Copper acquisition factor BIM1-like domain-containing protein n=2 Tax=Melanopsichium pennsylvanicum TaxID=63383 RepID=A0AAJ4XSZ9_9BASI|nr:conserved hypothetical protein [Melanopsichium pennsylvanicum 4]SNX87446.1 uncharacterized protein MEPE_06156 [Melanopsichium pennsylvanicum]
MKAAVLSILALASSAVAHFTLDYPATRGFDEDLESNSFCGGFSNVSLPRIPWYYVDGPIQIDSHHDSAIVNIYVSFDIPTSAQSFLSTSPLRHDISITGQGEFCFHANTTFVGGKTGQNATLMVEYINNVHGHLYQCSDVTFTDDKSAGANISCTDSLTAASSASTGITSGTATSATATSSSTAAAKANGATVSAGFSQLLMIVSASLIAGALTLF